MMKAAHFNGPGIIELSQYDIIEPPPGWVRIQVASVGICGTDLHLLQAHNFPNEGMRPGHELAGYVDVAGDDVEFKFGEQVSVEPLLGCDSCFSCHTGHRNRCSDFRVFGVHEPGGIAEYINVPAELVYGLPKTLDPKIGALCEPMAVVVRGVRRGRVGIGSRVAVLGAGSIGLLAIVAARSAGATDVYATARYPRQAELAKAMGATQVFSSGKELLKELGNQHIDVALETVGGSADTIAESCRLVRPGGAIVMLGIFDGNTEVPGYEFAVRELSMFGSSCYARDETEGDFSTACKLVVQHEALLKPLNSHTFSLDQVQDAFATAADKSKGAIKIQIVPPQQ